MERQKYYISSRAAREPIFGKQAKYTSPGNPFYPVRIQTTLHKSCAKAEEVIEVNEIKKGGLVLM